MDDNDLDLLQSKKIENHNIFSPQYPKQKPPHLLQELLAMDGNYELHTYPLVQYNRLMTSFTNFLDGAKIVELIRKKLLLRDGKTKQKQASID